MTDAAFILSVLEDGQRHSQADLPALIRSVTPEPPMRSSLSDPDYPEILRRRISRRVVVNSNGCWVWQGSLNRKGYGMMGAFGNKGAYAHRVSFTVFTEESPLPDGWTLDHLCRNRACVNFDHLEAVPHGVNVRRGDTGIIYASRTHCKNGHEFAPENTFDRGREGRGCRACRREADRRYKARRKAAS